MKNLLKFCKDHDISVTMTYTTADELITLEFKKYDGKFRKYLYCTRYISPEQLFSSNINTEDNFIMELIKEFGIVPV